VSGARGAGGDASCATLYAGYRGGFVEDAGGALRGAGGAGGNVSCDALYAGHRAE